MPGINRKNSGGFEYEFSEEELADLKEVFEMFIVDGSGSIETKELKVAMRHLGCEPEKEEMERMLLNINKQHASVITYDDFVSLMTIKMSDRSSTEELIEAFKLFDCDCTGKITFSNFKRFCQRFGKDCTDEELQEMINKADKDGDGEVSQEEFIQFMQSPI